LIRLWIHGGNRFRNTLSQNCRAKMYHIHRMLSSGDAKGSRAGSLEAKSRWRRAGQFGAQQGEGASKRLTRPPTPHNRTGFRASCPRIGRGLNMDADWRRTLRDCGLIAGADNSWLRLRAGLGRGLVTVTDSARTRTRPRARRGCGRLSDRTRTADQILARTFRGQSATVARTQKPHCDEG
jgi:hypothetical protein